MQGGSGADIFVYSKGDGNDLIVDYDEKDTIQIKSGKITVMGAAGKNINVTNASGATESSCLTKNFEEDWLLMMKVVIFLDYANNRYGVTSNELRRRLQSLA